MFTKTVIRQGKTIMALSEENKALYRENQENRYELAELEEYKVKNEKMKNRIISDLLNLQEVSRLGIAETEKDKHRNVIINKIINELSSTVESFR